MARGDDDRLDRAADSVRRGREIIGLQDHLVLAWSDGGRVDLESLTKLPPWRAVMWARLLLRTGMLEHWQVQLLVDEAMRVGGRGTLTVRTAWPVPPC